MRRSFKESVVAVLIVLMAVALSATFAFAQKRDLPQRDLSDLPAYKPEYKVAGGFRIFGSELKGAVEALAVGFKKYHPDVMISTNFMTSSEGAMAGLYVGVSDLAPAGDDAKITDMMPFYSTFRYLPTEISIATGGHEATGHELDVALAVGVHEPAGITETRERPLPAAARQQPADGRLLATDAIAVWLDGSRRDCFGASRRRRLGRCRPYSAKTLAG